MLIYANETNKLEILWVDLDFIFFFLKALFTTFQKRYGFLFNCKLLLRKKIKNKSGQFGLFFNIFKGVYLKNCKKFSLYYFSSRIAGFIADRTGNIFAFNIFLPHESIWIFLAFCSNFLVTLCKIMQIR